MPALAPISAGCIGTRSVAPWIIDQGFVTLQHPTKLTQYLGVICIVIDRNGEYYSRPFVLAVIVLESGLKEHDPGILCISHISRHNYVSVPDKLLELWIGGSYP